MASNSARPTPPACLAGAIGARFHRALIPMLGLLLLASCGEDGLAPGIPATISLSETEVTFTALGQNHLLLAVVSDRQGHAVSTTVSWSTSDPSIVRVNGDGLATAAAAGSARVTVRAGVATAVAGITVHQAPAHIIAVQGDGQGGPVSQALLAPLMVQVTDALNHPVPGVAVSFATADPGASVDPAGTSTDAFGLAQTTLTLGPAEGRYSVIATVTGTSLAIQFTLRSSGPFSIDLVWVNQPTPSHAQAFALAQQRWESIITADLPDDYAALPANSCGPSPAIDRPIDDLLIFVSIENIDGPGGILGQAAPCFVHSVGLLPAIGHMTFDVADLDAVESLGLLSAVVTHEMGHVLGYGTLWTDQGLLADPAALGGLDPHFTGAQASVAFDALGGAGYLGGKVPVEDQGGPGTADGHWRESVFDNELMTGWLNLGFNPLSAVSIASLGDLGYAVDESAADNCTIAAPLRAPGPQVLLHLENDVGTGPIRIIDRHGKIVGTYRH